MTVHPPTQTLRYRKPYDMLHHGQQFWKSLSSQNLLRLVITVSALCISYEGMSQGIMGAVTGAPEFGVGPASLHSRDGY